MLHHKSCSLNRLSGYLKINGGGLHVRKPYILTHYCAEGCGNVFEMFAASLDHLMYMPESDLPAFLHHSADSSNVYWLVAAFVRNSNYCLHKFDQSLLAQHMPG
jgi:hypothetical protein